MLFLFVCFCVAFSSSIYGEDEQAEVSPTLTALPWRTSLNTAPVNEASLSRGAAATVASARGAFCAGRSKC